MDEVSGFEVTTDLSWLRDNTDEADDFLERLAHAGTSGTLPELARQIRAVKGGSGQVGPFKLSCPPADEMQRLRASLRAEHAVARSENVRALIDAVYVDLDICNRIFQFPPSTTGTLRGTESVHVIEFRSDKPLRHQAGSVISEFNPPGTWLIEYGPLNQRSGRERVPFEDVTDVTY